MILKIWGRYSDEYRLFTQKRILVFLDIEYGMKCDRRSVKANLISLRTCLKSFKNSFGVERLLSQFFQSLCFFYQFPTLKIFRKPTTKNLQNCTKNTVQINLDG